MVRCVLTIEQVPDEQSRTVMRIAAAFARDRSRYTNPGYVGSRFRVTWTVTNTYEQRGKIYQDYVALVQDERGAGILRRDLASTFFMLGKVKTYALGETK